MKIDFVSDVACPWCAVGLNSLEEAIRRIQQSDPNINIQIDMQPFELNPDMADGGVDAGEYLMKKYGMSAEQLQAGRATLRARGAEVGFSFGDRSRVWNTFDAHRLLFWAGQVAPEKQRALKHALLTAYHQDNRSPADQVVLLELVAEVGLDVDVAQAILTSDLHTTDVRKAEKYWQQNGITAVPSVIINGRHLIQGGQSPDTFEQAIRQIASTASTA